jgi:hypothetical protein
MKKLDRALSIVYNIDLSKTVSTQLMLAAACIEFEDVRQWLAQRFDCERESFTGEFLSCSPSLGTYIKRFQGVMDYLQKQENPKVLWTKDNGDYLNYYGNTDIFAQRLREQIKRGKDKDIAILRDIKQCDYIEEIKALLTDNNEGENIANSIDSWATGIKTDIFVIINILYDICNEIVVLIYENEALMQKPSNKTSLANGLRKAASIYEDFDWPQEEQAINI